MSRNITAAVKRFSLATALAVLVGSVAACSPGADVEPSPTIDATRTAVIAVPVDAAPQFILTTHRGTVWWKNAVFETLMVADPETFEPVPVVAETLEVSEDGLSVDITLRDDVTFHTGRGMTAEDVIYSYEQAKLPENGSAFRFMAEAMVEFDAVSDYELVITLDRPLPSLLEMVYLTPIVDSETWVDREATEEIVGTGPFVWDTWNPGASLTVTKYEDYRDADNINLAGIEFAIISDRTAQVSAMTGGRADLAYELAPADILPLRSDPRFAVDSTAGSAVFLLLLDVLQAPLDNPDVRQAIGFAIDRERIIDQVLPDSAIPSSILWTPGSADYNEDQADYFSYDPERAAELIEDAGAAGATLTAIVPEGPQQQAIFEIIANNLAEVGITLTPEVISSVDWNERKLNKSIGGAVGIDYNGGFWSPSTWVSSRPSLQSPNISHFEDPEWDELKAAVTGATSREESVEAVFEMTEFMLEQSWVVPIAQTDNVRLRDVTFDGVIFYPGTGMLYNDAHFTE